MALSELSVVSRQRELRPSHDVAQGSTPEWAQRGGEVALQQVAELLSGPIRRVQPRRPQSVLCLTREMRRLDQALAILQGSTRL